MKIGNDYLEAAFTKKGAELTSLKKLANGVEYIWQGDPKFWSRRAPVLFPVVGKLRNNSYSYNNRWYELGQHGFARDELFNLLEIAADKIRFSMTDTKATFKKYPFRFELIISYKIAGQTLVVEYEVKNLDSPDLLFSIGGHPAFNCPLASEESRSDYWLEFDKGENACIHLINDGLFTGETKQLLDGEKIEITDSLFERDALVFKNLKSTKVNLVSPKGRWLSFDFTDFPYLGIWSKSKDAPFICIEPWFGLADHSSHNQDLMSKEGIIFLKKGQSFTCSYQMEVF